MDFEKMVDTGQNQESSYEDSGGRRLGILGNLEESNTTNYQSKENLQ